jgi:hypothetical protein
MGSQGEKEEERGDAARVRPARARQELEEACACAREQINGRAAALAPGQALPNGEFGKISI